MKTRWKESGSDHQGAVLLIALGVCLWLVVQLSIVQLLVIIEGDRGDQGVATSRSIRESPQQITR